MIISVIDRDKAILENLITTLEQTKQGGVANQRLVLNKKLSTIYTNRTSNVGAQNTFNILSDGNAPIPSGFGPGWLVKYYNDTFAVLTWDPDTLSGTVDGVFLGAMEGGNTIYLFETAATTCTVNFYVDSAKTLLLFSVNNTDYPEAFTVSGDKTFFVPADEWINFAPGISTTYSQKLYYWTAVFGDSTTLTDVYRNSKNLLFESVKVYSKANPASETNENLAYFVPSKPHEEVRNSKTSDDRAYVIVNYDLYVSLNSSECDLDETAAILLGYTISNLVRNALYTDRYRDHNATLLNENINGTFVSPLVVMPGDGYFLGMMKVQCVYEVESTSY